MPRASTVVLCSGMLFMALPVLWDAWKASGLADVSSQVPFVLVSSVFLIWRDRRYLALRAPRGLWPTALVFLVSLPVYVLAQIAGFTGLAYLACWTSALALCRIELGDTVLRRFWFVALYLLLLVTPSNRFLLALTKPLKLWLTQTAVAMTRGLGLDVGASGVIIQVDGYQVQVATACSGVNSLIGLAAITLFYVYFQRGDQPLFAFLLCALGVPVAVIANLVRVLFLILATHFWGDGVLESWLHPVSGLAVFALVVLALFVLDSTLYPRYRAMRRRLA